MEIEERRQKVAALWLAHVSQPAIARQLKCGQATVSRDIKAIRLEYKAERTDIIDREAAELDHIERECAVRYQGDKSGEWLDRRLKVKERRARMLGLDAPTRSRDEIELTINGKRISDCSDEELRAAAEGSAGGAGQAGASEAAGESGK